MAFFDRLESSYSRKGTLLCVGLDPRVKEGQDLNQVFDWARRLIEATLPYAACYKPNIAFYEACGPKGIEILQKIIDFAPEETPVILDAKRCDIGPTAEAYAKSCFDILKADAVTLSPYMGRDAVDPFLSYTGKALFLLARTSNPQAGVFQDIIVDGEPLYVRVASECASWSDSVGLVVAGNDERALAAVRRAAPNAWFLAPGIGSQGGDIGKAWTAGSRADGRGIIPVVARAVAEADDPAAAAKGFAETMRKAAEGGRGVPAVSGTGYDALALLKRRVMCGLVETACFKIGSFTLKSGKVSPFYIDLRRVIADPALLDAVAEAYALAAKHLKFDRIAGIPAAALPLATAVSLKTGIPMIWPRMPAKDHGTGVRVEGVFTRGERVLLLDDLITTGASKLEAVEILRGEGLIVEDLVVLIERGKQGRRELENAGIRLGAFFHVRELFALCESLGVLSAEDRISMEAYADAE